MSLVVNLQPETEILLKEAAAQEGIDADAFFRAPLRERLRVPPGMAASLYTTATTEELNQAIDALAQRNHARPVLPPEAFDRESLYDEGL